MAMQVSNFEQKRIRFIRTDKEKLGVPVLWENTKDFKTMIRVIKILDEKLETPSPIFISLKVSASLMPIKEGYYILKFFKDPEGISASVLKILDIDKYSNEAACEMIFRVDTDGRLTKNATISIPESHEFYDKLITIIEENLDSFKK